MAAFLERRRTGTSEQFAAAFTLMARALGYPTRVAVGFRRGVAHDGRFAVTSLDAYAWPEVHFANLGWVPFDPTPDPTGAAAAGAAAAPVTAPGSSTGGATQLVPQGAGTAPDTTTTTAGGSRVGHDVVLGLLGALVVALLLCPLAITLLKRRRTERRRRADSPARRVLGAWQEALEQLAAGRVEITPALTNTEVVSTAWVHLGPEVAADVSSLRTLANQALFSADPPTEAQADQAWATTDQMGHQLRAGLDRAAPRVGRRRPAPALVEPRAQERIERVTVSRRSPTVSWMPWRGSPDRVRALITLAMRCSPAVTGG